MQPPPITADNCKLNDLVPKTQVADWPEMSGQSVIAFRRWTNIKPKRASKLMRKGDRIFEVGEAELARCIYNHPRQF